VTEKKNPCLGATQPIVGPNKYSSKERGPCPTGLGLLKRKNEMTVIFWNMPGERILLQNGNLMVGELGKIKFKGET